VLQNVAMCCSVLQSDPLVEVHLKSVMLTIQNCGMLQRVAACCSVLQRVAACCSVVYRVAIRSTC